jgi:hypothetical protein
MPKQDGKDRRQMDALRFRKDGTFTILQVTDLHYRNGGPADQQTLSLLSRLIQAEKPDLVVLTGDVVHSENVEQTLAAYTQVMQALDAEQTPWATVFGNHDADNCRKEDLLALQQASLWSRTIAGPDLGDRLGNYVLELEAHAEERTAAALYLLDSGGDTTHPIGGYQWITHSQIGWYQTESGRLTHNNGGVPLPALAFFHIPLPEYHDLWNYHTCYGENREGMGCPQVNSGLFAAFVEAGDVKGVFVGHDHINDFWGELWGIRLCYGRSTGCSAYGQEDFQRGGRIIQLTEGQPGFKSWLRLEDGTVLTEQAEHPPEHIWKRI